MSLSFRSSFCAKFVLQLWKCKNGREPDAAMLLSRASLQSFFVLFCQLAERSKACRDVGHLPPKFTVLLQLTCRSISSHIQQLVGMESYSQRGNVFRRAIFAIGEIDEDDSGREKRASVMEEPRFKSHAVAVLR